MPYSHHPHHPHHPHHHTSVKSHNTLVKTEEHNLAAQLTFQHKKKKSCICKCILVIFILAGIVTSTIFLVHFLAQKLNLDQDYSKQFAAKFTIPSFSSLRSTDTVYSTGNRNDYNYADKSKPSSQEGDKSPPKWSDQLNPKSKNSDPLLTRKRIKTSSTSNLDTNASSHENNNATSPHYNFTNMQFWKYFQKENPIHPERVRKTDILNEETSDVHLTIPQYAVLRGVKITEFGNRMFKFLSIPYARPPIGDLRFSEPIEYKPKSPDTVIDARHYGAICPQFFDEILVKTVTPLTRNMSEDCLTLNIWSPRLPNTNNVNISDRQPSAKSNNSLWTILTEDTMDFEEEESNSTKESKASSRKARHFAGSDNLLPVMVWIHGGGFSMGSTALDEYDGSILSSYGHVIVVTINYRLGVFGFFNLNSPDATGNQGLKDQVMALKWVKKHIKHFGGDPNRITIFGQSAGEFAVGLHMISPNAKGLFRRAILQSGSPVVFDQFYSNTYNIAKRLVQYVDCEEKDELETSNPLADTTEATTNEEETEEAGEEEGDDSLKGEEKVHAGLALSVGSGLIDGNSDALLWRRKRADDNEGDDDDDGEDEEEEKSGTTTIASSSSLTTSAATTSTTEAPSPSTSEDAVSSSTTTTAATTSTSTTTEKTTTEKEDEESEDDDEADNKDESKSTSLATEASSSSTSAETTTSTTTTTTARSTTEKTFFTTASVGSTSTLGASSSNKSTAKNTERTAEDELRSANKILKCMQSKSMKTLIKAQKNAMQNSMFPFSPNKHDSILLKMPAEVIKQDASAIFFHSNVEQVLLGVNKDEGSLYLHLTMPQLFPSENLTLNINRLSDLRNMLAYNLTNAFKVPRAQATIVANLLLSNGPEIDTSENLVRKYYQLIADLMFNCPTVMLADELVKLNYQTETNHGQNATKKKQVYFYRFNERPSITNWGPWMGITHHEEVQFVFGMPLKYPLKYNSKDLMFSKRIMKTWAHFAKTGQMLPQLDLQWPSYNRQQQLMELSAFESKLTEKLHEKNCNLFRNGFESFMKRRKRFIS